MNKLLICFLMLIFCLPTSLTTAEQDFFAPFVEVAISSGEDAGPVEVCEHIYRIAPGSPIVSDGWYSLNELHHEYRECYTAACIHGNCAAVDHFCIASQLELHTWEYSGVNQHLADTGYHAYTHQCPVCHDIKDVLLRCYGTGNGDCPVQLRKTRTP